jgi:ribonuclease Z
MDLDLVFLGTAGSVPTPRRGLSSALIRRGGHRLLIDCGEGTQRQLMRSTGMADIDMLLITHLHTDHFLGMPGMLKTFNLRERTAPLTVVGPRGILPMWKLLRPVIGRLEFDVEVVEAADGWQLGADGYKIDAFATAHSVPSVGYRLVEPDRPGTFDVAEAERLGVPSGPLFGRLQRGESVQLADGSTIDPSAVVGEARSGRTVVYTGDTEATVAVREAARDATVLVHEATFCEDERDRADATRHATARDAALLAAAANVQMLVLTHVSNRYGGREIAAEAREFFPGAICAEDFDIIEIPYPERGEPRHIKRGARPRRTPERAQPLEA